MRRKTAKEIIAESFRELAQKKAADKITVAEIAENCGYSPATFYRQFKDKYDLIAWDYTREIEKILSNMGAEGYSYRKILLEAARYYQAQKDYLENLFLHTRGMDSFIYYMQEIHYKALKDSIIKLLPDQVLNETLSIYIRIYVLGTVHLTCEWILGHYHISPEELAEVYGKSIPEPLKEYLL